MRARKLSELRAIIARPGMWAAGDGRALQTVVSGVLADLSFVDDRDDEYMTPYGKLLRWGAGWWLRPDADDGEGAPPGVADQLRAIDAGDPSWSLGPRRP